MSDLRALVRPPLARTEAYDPGPTIAGLQASHGVSSLAKLNWNEDLFGLLPGVREAVVEELARAPLYPEQAYSDFRRVVGDYAGVDPSMIVPAHGIQALVLAAVAVFVESGDRVVVPRPTYGLYRQACEAAGAEVVYVVTDGYRLDLEEMAACSKGAKLVFVADPNNPTGDSLSPAEWEKFMDSLDDGCLAVVDEAYADYLEADERPERASQVAAGERLVVLRTFSKLFGIAGLRLGYALVHPDLVPCFDAVQEPFNVNRLALAAGRACLADRAVVEARRREVVAARDGFIEALSEIGIPCVPSQGNFVLAETGGDDAAWFEELVQRGFLVRPGSEFGLPGHLRVTVAPEPLMSSLARAMGDTKAALADSEAQRVS